MEETKKSFHQLALSCNEKAPGLQLQMWYQGPEESLNTLSRYSYGMTKDLIENTSTLQVDEAKLTLNSHWESHDHKSRSKYHSDSMEYGYGYQHTEHVPSRAHYHNTSRSCRMSTASTRILKSTQATVRLRPANEGKVLGIGEATDFLGIGAQFRNAPYLKHIPQSQVAGHVYDKAGLYSNTSRESHRHDTVIQGSFSLDEAGPGLPRLTSRDGDGGHVIFDVDVALNEDSGWKDWEIVKSD